MDEGWKCLAEGPEDGRNILKSLAGNAEFLDEIDLIGVSIRKIKNGADTEGTQADGELEPIYHC